MNLNENFISIQGIILNAEKSPGALKKIKYRGGHEPLILNITMELQKLLSAKKYIKNNKINEAFNEQIKEICLFLMLNTELKAPLDEPEFQHLINIMPQLSTCVLANVIVELDLCKQYCEALQRFSLDITEECLVEIVLCLKKCKPKIHIQNAYEFLNLIIGKVSVSTEKVAEGIDKLTDVASQLLLNLTGLHGEVQNVKIDVVYECMGLTLLNLLTLLLMSNEKNSLLKRIIERIIKTCCSIVMAVTIDVFCSWAEVEHDGEVLQISVAGKSYMFIEKYQKYPLAKELISMLGTIAQKPKGIDELVHSADVPTIISMINKADANQKDWFRALLNTQVLKCEDSIKCIDRWAHLCNIGDVSRLLNLSVLTKDVSAKKSVVKCAATLELEEIILITTRHFYQHGLDNPLTDDVQPQLVLLFNKIKDKNIGDEFYKELHLLLLQNLRQTLSFIFAECLKNTFYSCNLATVWPSIKEIVMIDDVGIKALKNEINENPPNEHNFKNYTELFNALINASIYSIENMALGIFLPMLEKSYGDKNYQLLKHGLEVLKDLQGSVMFKTETECVFHFLFGLMKNCRCNFLSFDGLKQEVVRQTVDVVGKYCDANCSRSLTAEPVPNEDFFVSFYKRKLFERNPELNVLKHFFPISFENHAEVVAHLIKILPLCVIQEWMIISSNLVSFCGVEKTTELLCDFMILLCELINSQETKTEEVKCMLSALKYCLHNFGVVIKECVQPKVSNLKQDVTITRNMCRVLREIPAGNLKSEEGLSLANLLSDVSLKSLRADKKFACLVASIHESHICKMLAEKILS